MMQCHRQLKNLESGTASLIGLEGLLTENLVKSLSGQLQDVMVRFKATQNSYTKSKNVLRH